MKSIAKSIDKIMGRISYIAVILGVISILILVVIITLHIIMRHFFNKPMMHTIELSSYLFIAISYLGFAYAARTNSHINVDIVTKHFSLKTQNYFNLFGSVLALVLVSIYLKYAFKLFYKSLVSGKSAWTTLNTPLWIPQSLMVIGLCLFCFEIIINIVKQSAAGRQTASPHSEEDKT